MPATITSTRPSSSAGIRSSNAFDWHEFGDPEPAEDRRRYRHL